MEKTGYMKILLTTEPKNFKVKLFEYQLKSLRWMVDIEKNKCNNIFYPNIELSCLTNHKNLSKLNFDVLDRNFILENHRDHKLITSGGILADEMGLGKTLTTVALICKNTCVLKPNIELDNLSINITNNKLSTRATLIICPSHLTKQWSCKLKKLVLI